MTQTDNPRTANVGDTLPVFARQTGLQHWNRYAAVNYEFVPIHMDDEAGVAAGYPSAFGMGNLQWSYLHNMLRDWLRDEGRIHRLGIQFRSPNLKGQTVTVHGVVKAIRSEGAHCTIDLDVWAENEDGVRMAPGTAAVILNPMS